MRVRGAFLELDPSARQLGLRQVPIHFTVGSDLLDCDVIPSVQPVYRISNYREVLILLRTCSEVGLSHARGLTGHQQAPSDYSSIILVPVPALF